MRVRRYCPQSQSCECLVKPLRELAIISERCWQDIIYKDILACVVSLLLIVLLLATEEITNLIILFTLDCRNIPQILRRALISTYPFQYSVVCVSGGLAYHHLTFLSFVSTSVSPLSINSRTTILLLFRTAHCSSIGVRAFST
jgi:hypothetical protein